MTAVKKKSSPGAAARMSAAPKKRTVPRIKKYPDIPTSAFNLKDPTEKIQYLLKAGEILSSSLDYETTVKSVADLVVPNLAEWCTIHVRGTDGTMKQIAIAHTDPKMVKFAYELNKKYPTDYDADTGTGAVLKTGKSQLISEVTDEMLIAGAKDEEMLQILRKLRLGSVMTVPLPARGKIIGVLSFLSTKGKHYNEDDLKFAQTLAVRVALAVDNAQLYRESQSIARKIKKLNEELEQKVAERTKELIASQEQDKANLLRLKSMLANLPMAALMTDEKNTLLELNERYCMIFNLGITPKEAMKLTPKQLTDRFLEGLANPANHMTEVMKTIADRKQVLGHEIHLKDGRLVIRDFLPIFEEGKFLGQIFVYRDVTKERRIDAAKSEFMSLASHQLRTPLTSMRWAMSMLHRSLYDKANEFEKKLLIEGRIGVGRMSETIDTMLQISRIESGEIRPVQSPIDLAPFLTEIVKIEHAAHSDKDHEVTLDCEEGLTLESDPNLLRQALSNLIDNAFKYTPEKGTIRLKVLNEGSIVSIAVHDNGYGIPKRQQSSIFRKFFRGDNIVDKVTSGTGLGLYLVSLLTGILGGSVEFVSTEGRGTTFTLRLPVR